MMDKYTVVKIGRAAYKVKRDNGTAYYKRKVDAERAAKFASKWYASFKSMGHTIVPVGGHKDTFKITSDIDPQGAFWFKGASELAALHNEIYNADIARRAAAAVAPDAKTWQEAETWEQELAQTAAPLTPYERAAAEDLDWLYDFPPAPQYFEVSIIPTEVQYGQYEMEYTIIRLSAIGLAPAVLPFIDTAWAAQS